MHPIQPIHQQNWTILKVLHGFSIQVSFDYVSKPGREFFSSNTGDVGGCRPTRVTLLVEIFVHLFSRTQSWPIFARINFRAPFNRLFLRRFNFSTRHFFGNNFRGLFTCFVPAKFLQ